MATSDLFDAVRSSIGLLSADWWDYNWGEFNEVFVSFCDCSYFSLIINNIFVVIIHIIL